MPDIARTRGERPMEDRMAVVRDSVAAGSLLLELLELTSWDMAAAMRTAMLMFR